MRRDHIQKDTKSFKTIQVISKGSNNRAISATMSKKNTNQKRLKKDTVASKKTN